MGVFKKLRMVCASIEPSDTDTRTYGFSNLWIGGLSFKSFVIYTPFNQQSRVLAKVFENLCQCIEYNYGAKHSHRAWFLRYFLDLIRPSKHSYQLHPSNSSVGGKCKVARRFFVVVATVLWST